MRSRHTAPRRRSCRARQSGSPTGLLGGPEALIYQRLSLTPIGERGGPSADLGGPRRSASTASAAPFITSGSSEISRFACLPRQTHERDRGTGGPYSRTATVARWRRSGARFTTRGCVGTGVSLPCTVNEFLVCLVIYDSQCRRSRQQGFPSWCYSLFCTLPRSRLVQGDGEPYKKARWVVLADMGPPTSPKFSAPDRPLAGAKGADQPPPGYRRTSDSSGFPRAWSYALRTRTRLVLPRWELIALQLTVTRSYGTHYGKISRVSTFNGYR